MSRKTVRFAAASLAVAVTFPVVGVGAALAKKPEGKVTICHRTNSTSNPYNQLTVAESSVDGDGGNDHYGHTGPLWNPSMPNGGEWGDIIPPVPGVHDGLNWSALGKVYWRQGCQGGELPPVPGYPTIPITPELPVRPGKPDLPIVILPGGGGSSGGGGATVDPNNPSVDIKVKIKCFVNGKRADNKCKTVVKKKKVRFYLRNCGASSRVQTRGDFACPNVKVKVRVVAKRDGLKTRKWKGTWRLG